MDIDSISGQEALECVSKMLTDMVEIHERVVGIPTESRKARLSSSEAEREAALVAANINTEKLQDGATDTAVVDETDESHLHNRFWLKAVPKISINDYLLRFDKYCRSSPATYLATGRYIYEMSVTNKRMPITRNNVYRLFAAAYSNAAKVVEDVCYPYKRYATTGGLTVAELGKLEVSFAFLCNFEFKVDAELLQLYADQWSM